MKLLLLVSLWLMLPHLHSNAATPAVQVSNIRRAFHNGEHNAFTDLVQFKGSLYLCFRSCPDGHMVFNSSSVIILHSGDEGKSWRQALRFSVPQRDTRDPHFLIFKDRLFVYTGTWWSGEGREERKDRDMNLMLGYAVHSADGASWSNPILLEGTFGSYIWRATSHGSRAYLCTRRKPHYEAHSRGEGEKVQALLLESEDGLVWRHRAYLNESLGDETALLMDASGNLTAIGRNGSGGNAFLIRSRAPEFSPMNRQPLPRSIGGPLLATWGDRLLVGGRHQVEGLGPKTSLCWLNGDNLEEFAQLPSGGDNSYPGFVALSPTRGLVSWYSSHEKDAQGKTITAIYLADLSLRP